MATLLTASLRRRTGARLQLPAAPQLCRHRQSAAAVAAPRGLTALSPRRPLLRPGATCISASWCRGCGGARPMLSALHDLVREFATGPPASRAERRRQARNLKKKGKPLPAASAIGSPTAAQKSEDEKYKAPTIELSGITDLGIYKSIKHNFTTHGGAFVGYWGGCWLGMYVLLWACMENAGIDAIQWVQKAGIDNALGVDVGSFSPTLINGLVAIEVNYLLEFARMPIVLFLLKKRNTDGQGNSAPTNFGKDGKALPEVRVK